MRFSLELKDAGEMLSGRISGVEGADAVERRGPGHTVAKDIDSLHSKPLVSIVARATTVALAGMAVKRVARWAARRQLGMSLSQRPEWCVMRRRGGDVGGCEIQKVP